MSRLDYYFKQNSYTYVSDPNARIILRCLCNTPSVRGKESPKFEVGYRMHAHIPQRFDCADFIWQLTMLLVARELTSHLLKERTAQEMGCVADKNISMSLKKPAPSFRFVD